MLAQADHDHLEQTALNGTVIAGVRLDPANDADVIGLGSMLVENNREALARAAKGDNIHARLDRDADIAFGDAVALDDLALTGRGAAAVAAHRGDKEWFCSERLEKVGHAFEHQRNIGYSAAARRQGYRVPRLDPPPEV